jgi:hypothetical protein
MQPKEVKEAIERATKLVKSWPLWKQNILVNSGQATLKIPRRPVVNTEDE